MGTKYQEYLAVKGLVDDGGLRGVEVGIDDDGDLFVRAPYCYSQGKPPALRLLGDYIKRKHTRIVREIEEELRQEAVAEMTAEHDAILDIMENFPRSRTEVEVEAERKRMRDEQLAKPKLTVKKAGVEE